MREFTCAYCGTNFVPEEETPAYSARGDEKTLWFCSPECNDEWWAFTA